MYTTADTPYSRTVGNALIRAGISPHFAGFAPLATAVQMSLKGDTRKRKLTGEIYPQVAKLHGTTARAVERSIRTAITRAWAIGALTTYFDSMGFPLKQRPSNSEFIALMAYTVSSATEE